MRLPKDHRHYVQVSEAKIFLERMKERMNDKYPGLRVRVKCTLSFYHPTEEVGIRHIEFMTDRLGGW